VLVTQRQLAEGLDAYQQSLNIRQILAEEDKSNSGSQRDLLFSYSKVCNALNDARQALEGAGRLPAKLGDSTNPDRARQIQLLLAAGSIGQL